MGQHKPAGRSKTDGVGIRLFERVRAYSEAAPTVYDEWDSPAYEDLA